MAFSKFGITLVFLLCGAVLLGTNLESVGVEACPQFCYGDAAYMTCPSSGNQHLAPACNCCLAGNGCTIYKADGTPYCTAS